MQPYNCESISDQLAVKCIRHKRHAFWTRDEFLKSTEENRQFNRSVPDQASPATYQRNHKCAQPIVHSHVLADNDPTTLTETLQGPGTLLTYGVHFTTKGCLILKRPPYFKQNLNLVDKINSIKLKKLNRNKNKKTKYFCTMKVINW